MNHWDLFKQTWRLFWRHPELWVFGLLAALGGGFNWNYGGNFDLSSYRNLQGVTILPFEARAILRDLLSNSTLNTLFFIVLVWALGAFLLATFAQGAIISIVSEVDAGRKVNVGDGFRAGARRFLPLLAVRFTLALPTLLIGLITASMALSALPNFLNNARPSLADLQGLGIAAGLGLISFVLGVLMIGIGVSAERAVVLEDLPIMPSLVQGWKLLWNKLGDYVVIVVLFIVVGIGAGIVFACILIPILCGALGANLGSFAELERGNPFVIMTQIAGPTLIVSVLLGLLFGTLVTVFTSGVWTLAYRQWRSDFFKPQATPGGPQPIEPMTSAGPIANPPPNDSTLHR